MSIRRKHRRSRNRETAVSNSRTRAIGEQAASRTSLLKRRCVLLVAVVAFGQGAAAVAADEQREETIRLFKRFCVRCHGAETQKAGIALHEIPTVPSVDRDLKQWKLILEMLDSGAMPPDGETQPSDTDRKAAVQWMEERFREAVSRLNRGEPVPVARRLTNFEYQNTLRDLLGFERNLMKYLPDDPARPYRFNNTAQYLLMGGEQLERYEENGLRAMASAIVNAQRPEVHQARREWKSDDGLNELAVEGNRRGSPADGLSIRKWPTHGSYRIRIKASGVFPEGTTEMPLRLVMGYSLAGDIGASPFEPVGMIRLTSEDSESRIYEFFGRIENHPWEPERKYRRGGTRTGNLVTIPPAMVITPQNLFDDGTLNDRLDPATRPRAVIDWIEFEAPFSESWPPVHHTRILYDSPLRESDLDAYVNQVLERFLRRAFRRPVQPDEIDRYMRIYRIYASRRDTLEESMRKTLSVALASPGFLYHVSGVGGLSHHYEIANRLSYFLWGTMPDEPLFDLASSGRLDDEAVIADQVRRMLTDSRSEDFIRRFSTQWLDLEKCRSVPVNTKLFPRFLHLVARGEHTGEEVPFRPTIRDDMVEETVAFVAALVARNESLLNIVDSDFAMLNERLAAHYGVAGIQGHELRRVPLEPNSRLGGILTQGSVLIGTGTGSAPHPIYRAVWLREAILGDEVKDPPADVPALEDSAGESAETASNIKELLRRHRQKTSCNVCHARLDPWGIPFEQYNAIGRFQAMVPKDGTRVRGFDRSKHKDLAGYRAYLQEINTVPVNAESRLPGGLRVNGLDELKAYLIAERADDIAANLVRRLLSYALGRPMTYRDHFAVEHLVEKSKSNDYRLQDLILSICQSDLFLKRGKP